MQLEILAAAVEAGPILGPFLTKVNEITGFTMMFGSIILTIVGFVYPVMLYFREQAPDHITYSNNVLYEEDGEMYVGVRTMLHLPRSDILPSTLPLNWKIARAQWRCSEEDPLFRLDMKDAKLCIPPMVSAFSSAFAQGFVDKQRGKEVERVKYYLVPTFEKYNDGFPHKFHVMVIHEDDIEKYLDEEFCDRLCVEKEKHTFRIHTLRLIAQQWKEEEDKQLPVHQRLVRPVYVYCEK